MSPGAWGSLLTPCLLLPRRYFRHIWGWEVGPDRTNCFSFIFFPGLALLTWVPLPLPGRVGLHWPLAVGFRASPMPFPLFHSEEASTPSPVLFEGPHRPCHVLRDTCLPTKLPTSPSRHCSQGGPPAISASVKRCPPGANFTEGHTGGQEGYRQKLRPSPRAQTVLEWYNEEGEGSLRDRERPP